MRKLNIASASGLVPASCVSIFCGHADFGAGYSNSFERDDPPPERRCRIHRIHGRFGTAITDIRLCDGLLVELASKWRAALHPGLAYPNHFVRLCFNDRGLLALNPGPISILSSQFVRC